MNNRRLRIGTRGSPLALAQAHETKARLIAAGRIAAEAIDIIVIRTTGDAITDRALSEAGGKGLFTKELDIAQLAGEIDIAVHSAKDLPTLTPQGLEITGCLPREDPRDALICQCAQSIIDLPPAALIGTASLRRTAQLLRLRPDLRTCLLRGNVETRLRKVAQGEVDATLLAYAGLRRLGFADRIAAVLSPEEFLPAVGQGAIALSLRANDPATTELAAAILCADTSAAVAAERAYLRVLDGSCRTPIAGHAYIENGQLMLRGMVLTPDGLSAVEDSLSGPAAQAADIGQNLGQAILARLPKGFLPQKN